MPLPLPTACCRHKDRRPGPLSPSGGYNGGGVTGPLALDQHGNVWFAIDSAGNLWTANFGNDSVTEFIGIAAPVRLPLIGLPRSP